MSNQGWNTTQTTPKLEVVELQNLVAVHIPDEVRDKIKFLCKSIAKDEWSGVLFYEVEGDIDDTDTMKITLKDIFLMDKGTKAYTSFDWDEDIVNYQMDNPEAMDWTIGHIHSHNTMDVFFSGTDWSELNDNCPLHNFYLSVIVNNYLDVKAKIAFTAESPNSGFTAKNKEGKDYNFEVTGLKTNTKMLVYDCEIHMAKDNIIVPETFAKRVTFIETKKERDAKAKELKDKKEAIKNPVVKYGETYDLRNKKNGKEPFPNYEGKTHEKSIAETFSDRENDLEEDDFNFQTLEADFITFVLRLGNKVKEDDELEDALVDIENSKMSMNAYKASIIESYPALYDKFFDEYPSYQGDQAFLDTLEDCIDILEAQEASYPFLTKIITALDNLRIKYEASIKVNS